MDNLLKLLRDNAALTPNQLSKMLNLSEGEVVSRIKAYENDRVILAYRTVLNEEKLGMDRVRAVEHGRTVVVAATSGVSAIVRPDGSVTQRTGLFTPAALVERVPLRSTATLSDRLGASPEWVMVIAGLGVLATALTLRVRRRAKVEVGDRRTSADEEENG